LGLEVNCARDLGPYSLAVLARTLTLVGPVGSPMSGLLPGTPEGDAVELRSHETEVFA
jgi:hypothetical protein